MEPAHLWRLGLLALLLVGAAVAIGVRVAFLQQAQQRDFLKGEGDARTVRAVSIEASRGVIRDRRGELLAVSAPVVSFYVNPQRFAPAPEEAEALAGALGMGSRALMARIDEARKRGLGFLYLKRRASSAQATSPSSKDVSTSPASSSGVRDGRA